MIVRRFQTVLLVRFNSFSKLIYIRNYWLQFFHRSFEGTVYSFRGGIDREIICFDHSIKKLLVTLFQINILLSIQSVIGDMSLCNSLFKLFYQGVNQNNANGQEYSFEKSFKLVFYLNIDSPKLAKLLLFMIFANFQAQSLPCVHVCFSLYRSPWNFFNLSQTR